MTRRDSSTPRQDEPVPPPNEAPIVPPPNTMTVPLDRKVVLYRPDGTPLTRRIGY